MEINREKMGFFIDEKYRILRAAAEAMVLAHVVNQVHIARLSGQLSDQALLEQLREGHKEMRAALTERRNDIRQAVEEGALDSWPALYALLQSRADEASELLDCIERQERELALMAGEKIEPMTHFANIVLVAKSS